MANRSSKPPRSLVVQSLVFLSLLITSLSGLSAKAHAQKVRLKDGRLLSGRILDVSGIAESPLDAMKEDGNAKATPILLIDDDLRRVFVPKFALASIVSQVPEPRVKIDLTQWQNVAVGGLTLGSVGPSLGITPFDKWGRRIYEMQTKDGPLSIVQGITELTPHYAKVEGLRGQPRPIVWDMRLATSSIPKDTLAAILKNAVSQENPTDWLQIVRFYLQAERYTEARRELEKLIERYPDMQELQEQVRELRQLGAQRILKEIELRRAAGQHKLVDRLLENFPAEQVAGETLQQVRETSELYANDRAKLGQVKRWLAKLIERLASDDHRQAIQPIVEELTTSLSRNNLDRLVPFLQLADDETLAPEQRIALAISGWLLGADGAKQEIEHAASLVQVRASVLSYLRESLAHKRLVLLASIESSQGAAVPDVARLLAHMRPPWEIPETADQGHGFYELTAPGKTEHGDFRYLVQLPPEYDPYRRYPTLLVLDGAYNSPEQELNFWAGSPPRDSAGSITGPRNGQAMRHGYITLAIAWHKPQQYEYEYSLREHEAVLACLRDATRRFNIDTDRVFLSGHGSGGDAVWDLAQAHPDLWAGVIPFVAKLDPVRKYLRHYWENAAYVPLYFVAGEKDGLKMTENASVWDEYLSKRFDTTVVEYLGRGQEPFHDEILEIFDWMALPMHVRRGQPEDFACKTMRPWDNFFWCLEGQGFPRPVLPEQWGKGSERPTQMECRVANQNTLWVKSPAEQTTIWLSPDLVDFSKPIEIKFNTRKLRREESSPPPSLGVLLEDVRTRGDRFRPFWAKVEVP